MAKASRRRDGGKPEPAKSLDKMTPVHGADTTPKAAKFTPAVLGFIHAYDANGGNGTEAYLSIRPKVKRTTAATESHRLLRDPKIAGELEKLATARWKRLQMTGDEALGRVALDAKADIRDLYDADGELLKPHLWPDSIAQSVKGIRQTPFGPTVILNDSLAARKLVLEQTGKLKNPLAALGASLAELLAGPDEVETTK